MMITVLLILIWVATFRINEYKSYHYLLGKNITNNLSESISKYIIEKKRLVQLFANEHTKLIKKSVDATEDENITAELKSKIKDYFPDFFSFTVTDENGVPFFDDFDGFISDLCVSDIKNYSLVKINAPRVHPNSNLYHYDLMSEINVSDKKYIFFVSFPLDALAEYLKNSEAIGHKTILGLKQNENLIEVTVDGARNKHFRKDYRLMEDELSYLIFDRPVLSSSWTVYDFYDPSLLAENKKIIIVETIFIFLVFSTISTLLFLLVKKEGSKRKKAESIKEEFVSIVSHELRTPLTSINGVIKLIENEKLGGLNDDMKPFVKMASENIDRLTNLVNDILDVKKMESGEFEINQEKINFIKLVEKSIFDNKHYADTFNTKIEFVPPAIDYFIFADKTRILQVIDNLLTNAIKYGAEADTIKIYFNDLGEKIRLNIEDHGRGIAEEFRSVLFDKFVQAHSRELDVVKGTGLGLNIAKTIMDHHGGEINFETIDKYGINSEITHATVFYIVLPLI